MPIIFAGSERTFGGNDVLGLNRAVPGPYRLEGGDGDDSYYIYDRNDKIVEAVDGGIDTAYSTVSYSINSTVENLTLVGNAAISGFGNNRANVLIGNGNGNALSGLAGDDLIDGGAGNDFLIGGLGNDTLTGGSGSDTFVFDAGVLDAVDEVDTLTDFVSGVDTLRISVNTLTGMPAGPLAESAFKDIATGALDADDRVVYNSNTGELFYDRNGSGNKGSVLFAVLDGEGEAGPALAASDFIFV